MKINELMVKYCDEIDEDIQDGILYIYEQYGIAIHNCACGCGQETVTGLQPHWKDGWVLRNDNGLVTLRPSIGNFKGENPYHAHYYITNNKIEWL